MRIGGQIDIAYSKDRLNILSLKQINAKRLNLIDVKF